MKKTITSFSARAAMMLLTALLTLTAQTAWADDVNIEATGQTVSDATTWTDCTVNITGSSTVTFSERITISGTVTLNIGSGATLTASKGIDVAANNTLTINGPGTLNATGSSDNAGIGGTSNTDSGTSQHGHIIINSGTINATGGGWAAGIGGGNNSTAGETSIIEIKGGVVNATGSANQRGIGTTNPQTYSGCGAGIGGASNNRNTNATYGMPGTIIITGGQVTARAGSVSSHKASGIGKGYNAGGNSGSLILGWTNTTDFIDVDSYDLFSMEFAEGKKFLLDGTSTVATTSNISGKKIVPPTSEQAKDLTIAGITGLQSSYEWDNGSPIPITYNVADGIGNPLTEGTHYTVTFGTTPKDASESLTVTDEGDYTLTFTAKDGSGYTGSQVFSFTVLDAPAGLSVDPDFPKGNVGHYYVNMPSGAATKTLNLTNAKVTTFIIYDDGGKHMTQGYYSNNCDAYLVINVPTGYVLQLSGYIRMKDSYDKLTVYDGNNNTYSKLINELTGTSYTHINPAVTSTGNSMTLYFHTSSNNKDEGLYLTAKLIKLMTNTDITVSIPSQEWTGSEVTFDASTVVVKDGETTLEQTTDYTVTAPSGTIQSAGDYIFTITGTGNYSGQTTATFTIAPKKEDYGAMVLTTDQTGKKATLDGASDKDFHITENMQNIATVTFNRSFTAGQKTVVCLPFDVKQSEAEAFGGKFYKFNGINGEGKIVMQEVPGVDYSDVRLAAHTPYVFEPATDMTKIDFSNKTLIKVPNDGPQTVGSGFTFKGNYKRVKWTTDTTDPLYDTEANLKDELGKAYGFALEEITVGSTTYHKGQFVKLGSGAHSRPFRAYLLCDTELIDATTSSTARTRGGEGLPDVLDIVWLGANGEETGIVPIHNSQSTIHNEADGWYSLDGRRLGSKPSAKGIYINNGRKVVIK